jgi:WD40 repeat protein
MQPPVCPDCGSELHSADHSADGPPFCPACTLGDLFDPLPDPPDVEMSGTIVGGRFRLIEKIGEGGFAEVWRASQLQPVQREVALKWLKRSVASPQVMARFEGERTALARMQHQGVASILEAGCEDGRPWFAAELMDGRPLTTACNAAGLDAAARCRLIAGICSAVQHAHTKGLIHRDLKPSNILTTRTTTNAATLTARVIDFGVARALEDPLHDGAATALRQLVGTPGYMSPEQATPGSTDVDTRTDIHALGVILYELLAGRLPWPPRSPRSPEASPPPWPTHSLATSLPLSWQRDLLAVCSKAMAFNPTSRYATASALADDIERVLLHQPVSARPPGTWYALTKFTRRHRAAVALGATALAALVAGLAASTTLYLRADRSAQLLRDSHARHFWLAAQQRKSQHDHHAALPLLARALESNPPPCAAADLLALTASARSVDLVIRSATLPPAWGQPVASRLRSGIAAVLFPDSDGHPAVLARWLTTNGTALDGITLPEGSWSRLDLTPNGRWAAVWGPDQQLCLVNLLTATTELRSWPRGGPATVVHIHPDGRNVMAGTSQGILWQLDGRISREEAVFNGALTALDAVRSDRGLLFVAATDRGSVHRWSPPLRNSAPPPPLFTMPAGVTALIAPDGARHVFAGDDAGNVQWISDSRPPALLSSGSRSSGPISQLIATPGARQLFAASRRGSLRGWNTDSREPTGASVDLAERVLAMDSDAGGSEILVAGEAGALRLWNPASGSLASLPSLTGAVALDADIREARGSWHLLHWLPESRSLCLLDTSPPIARPLPLEPHGATHLAWTSDNSITGWDDSRNGVRWSLPSLTKSSHLLPREGAPVIAWMPSGPSGSVVLHATGTLLLPDKSLTLLAPPPAESAWEHGALASDAPILATSAPRSSDAILHTWNLTGITETARLPQSSPISALALNASGDSLVCGLVSGSVVIHHRGTTLPQSTLHPGKVTAAACAPNGLAATGAEDGSLILWNLSTGRPHSDPIRLHDPVTHLAWDAAGLRLCAGTDSSLTLIDAATGTIIGMPLGIGLPLRALAMNPSGSAAAFSMTARGSQRSESCLWLLPPSVATAPPWFLNFARHRSGSRLEDGQLRPQPLAPRQSLAPLIPPHDQSHAAQLARWLTGSTSPEQIHPWLTLPAESVEALRSRWPQTRSVTLLMDEMERASATR